MKKAVYILLILFIIALISIGFIVQKKEDKPTQLEGEAKFIIPDRIVYKNDKNDYYIFEKYQEDFTELFTRISNGITSLVDGEVLDEDKINQIKSTEPFIELDYNSASKNFILPLNEENIGVIKMLSENGQVQTTKLNNKEETKEYLEKVTQNKEAMEFSDCKNYVSQNKISDEILLGLNGFEQKNTYYYQRKFTTNDEDFYGTLEQLNFLPEGEQTRDKFREKINFEKQNVIITISKFVMHNIYQKVGSITFIYDNKEFSEYRVNVTVVNKVANINCIYNNMDGSPETPLIETNPFLTTPEASPSPTTPEEIAKAKQNAKSEIEGYLLDGYRVDIGVITDVNVDSSGNGYIIVECRIGIDESVYPVKLKVNSQTETYLGMGMHLQSNYGYHPYEICDITLDTKITDIDNIQGYVKTIEYIAD